MKKLSHRKIDKLWEDYEKNDPLQDTDWDDILLDAQLEADKKVVRELIDDVEKLWPIPEALKKKYLGGN